MSDNLIPDARAFFADLAANNTRDWFVAEKPRYERLLKAPALALLDQLSDPLADLSGGPVTTKLFRPNRDVRFSKDKTPYHLHLHLAWGCGDGRAWFLGISQNYVTAGAGVMGFDKATLVRWRAAVDQDGAGLSDLLQTAAPRMDPPELKRVPAPYPADHPHADLLKRKSLAVWRDGLSNVDPATLTQTFTTLAPIMTWLGDHVTTA